MKTIDILRLCGTFANAGLTWNDIADLEKLNKAGKRLHRLNEKQCNGFQDYKGNWDQKASDSAEKQVTHLIEIIKGICKAHDWDVEINTDPRGWPLKVEIPIRWTGKSNAIMTHGQKTASTDISVLVNL